MCEENDGNVKAAKLVCEFVAGFVGAAKIQNLKVNLNSGGITVCVEGSAYFIGVQEVHALGIEGMKQLEEVRGRDNRKAEVGT